MTDDSVRGAAERPPEPDAASPSMAEDEEAMHAWLGRMDAAEDFPAITEEMLDPMLLAWREGRRTALAAGVAERRDPQPDTEYQRGYEDGQASMRWSEPHEIARLQRQVQEQIDDKHRILREFGAIDRRGTGAEPTALRAKVEEFVATYGGKFVSKPWKSWAEEFAVALRAGGPATQSAYDQIYKDWLTAEAEVDRLRAALVRLTECENMADYEAGYINKEFAARVEFAQRVLSGGSPPAPHQETEK